MSEFFKNRLDVAHALIDEGEFDGAVEIIQNLKTRIHDESILGKLTLHDNKTKKEYMEQYTECGKIGDPYESFKKAQEIRKWRAQEILRFYDKLVIEHDL